MSQPRLGALADGIYGEELDRRISAAADAISSFLRTDARLAAPKLAFVLGSGLGDVVELLDDAPRLELDYADIPFVPHVAVVGHAGRLVGGLVHGTPVLVLSGRAHPYEGYSHREATILLRACLSLGVETVVLTNAAGALNAEFDPGDVMLISDMINLSGENPLLGPNLDRFGPRFPAMADAFDPGLRERAAEAAATVDVRLREGVYIMLSGPYYETRAEMRMLRALGGDAVGMSTVHEVLVARHAGARVLAFSLITNKATDDVEAGATHEEVIEMGRIGAGRLVRLLEALLPDLA
ncbi:MAG TPA: purine-nucleoside phosphorylase [Candidatus Limnocylindria bacterium]|nr:purine-nucleoside phosphorylase [Candidatus Limnocylindria bacterium]